MLVLEEKNILQDKSDFLRAIRALQDNYLVPHNNSDYYQSVANTTLVSYSYSSSYSTTPSPVITMETSVFLNTVDRETFLLYCIGFSLAGLTTLTHLILAIVALIQSYRRYGDVIHGLCFHAAIIGLIEGLYVLVFHTLFQSRHIQVNDEFWRVNCKAYLFARIFLPGVFFYLLVCITISYRTINYPPRRCSESCTRLGYIVIHCLPWVICTGCLIPVIIMHKPNIDSFIKKNKDCQLVEEWSWLAPVSTLIGLPQLIILITTCLLCAYKPYKSREDEECQELNLRTKGTSSPNHVNNHQNNISLIGARKPSQYYREKRLLGGTPMRTARTLLMSLNCIEVLTQIPFGITSILQVVLRNLKARQLIPAESMNILFWLHLAFFPIASIFLIVFVLQIRKAFVLTETSIEREIAFRNQCHKEEVLHTTSMLSSV